MYIVIIHHLHIVKMSKSDSDKEHRTIEVAT